MRFKSFVMLGILAGLTISASACAPKPPEPTHAPSETPTRIQTPEQTKTQPESETQTNAEFFPCPTERPEICTKEYRPVCGQVDTGVRCITTPCPSTKEQTFGNACTACADKKVLGYTDGECPKE